ncbi:ECF RNA polymerase sigma factor SigH [Pirellulimonas nuda]|uniref:ECF RNA polymerase sigma factor SigH n=1 Tax=Pirellulimonas nuda TaxID=2528009 RepID=A0A518DD70_9BACT|nr:sigma-70 family RNA polymerase sigma factor [Pirellulimonas nuda]QDU89427.1 ECF RNA polymerase sigma factor SigH [Pirellulimonas nuda]
MDPDAQLEQAIAAAKGGDEHAIDQLLRRFHPELVRLADRKVGGALRRREAPSDVVQKTELEAYRSIGEFRGGTEPELRAWLTRILERNVLNAARANRAAKRDHRREQHCEPTPGETQLAWLTPGRGRHATASRTVLRAEAAVRLQAAVGRLPEAQRTAVTLRHLQGASLDEIVVAMDRTPAAVAGLLRRGLRSLREVLVDV